MSEVRAVRRMWRVLPIHLPAPGTVAAADLNTSICDARIALTLAMGRKPDSDGYPSPELEPAEQLPLFEVAA